MKPAASVSLDLDNKWSYLKTHGDSGWESFPSYLDILVPRVLDFLGKMKLRVTVFVVGQDAALEKNHEVLRAIAEAGHEIGNHSFNHEPWLHLYSRQELERDVAQAEECIERATGARPIGFRAPGYSLSVAALEILARRRYMYDSSTLPNLLAPLARVYYFANVTLNAEQKRQREVLGGTLRDALRPIKPYRWSLQTGSVVEIPITTLPIFRIPVHMSYLLCLRLFSERLALFYFDFALYLCRLTGVQPSVVFHPTDFLGCDDVRDLSFFPAMKLPSEIKIAFVRKILHRLCVAFAVEPLRDQAWSLLEAGTLATAEMDAL